MASPSRFMIVGGHTALDFFNTVAWRLSEAPEERIEGFPDLLRWAFEAELIDARTHQALATRDRRSPEETAAVLETAQELRELGYRLVEPLVLGKKPERADLRRLNELHSLYPDRLEWQSEGYAWTIGGVLGDPERLLHLLVRSVADFLTSREARHVAQCQDDRGCGFVFVNRSRARPRRWCSMTGCGNRAKAKRHYRRVAGS